MSISDSMRLSFFSPQAGHFSPWITAGFSIRELRKGWIKCFSVGFLNKRRFFSEMLEEKVTGIWARVKDKISYSAKVGAVGIGVYALAESAKSSTEDWLIVENRIAIIAEPEVIYEGARFDGHLVVNSLSRIGAYDVEITYDPNFLIALGVRGGTSTFGNPAAYNVSVPGKILIIDFAVDNEPSGVLELAVVEFQARDHGVSAPLYAETEVTVRDISDPNFTSIPIVPIRGGMYIHPNPGPIPTPVPTPTGAPTATPSPSELLPLTPTPQITPFATPTSMPASTPREITQERTQTAPDLVYLSAGHLVFDAKDIGVQIKNQESQDLFSDARITAAYAVSGEFSSEQGIVKRGGIRIQSGTETIDVAVATYDNGSRYEVIRGNSISTDRVFLEQGRYSLLLSANQNEVIAQVLDTYSPSGIPARLGTYPGLGRFTISLFAESTGTSKVHRELESLVIGSSAFQERTQVIDWKLH